MLSSHIRITEGKQTFQALILLSNVNSCGPTNKITDIATVVRKGVRGQVVGSGHTHTHIYINIHICK
jgi:hypothetical protein